MMNIVNETQESKNIEEGDCYKCAYYTPEFEHSNEKCYIYGSPNHGISVCHDWKLSEFWINKRGY